MISRALKFAPILLLLALFGPAPVFAQTSTEWTYCAREGGFCSFSGTMQVRYGANGVYVYKSLTNGTACSNTIFGDPLPNTAKACDFGTSSSSSWSVCAKEGGFCAFSGTQQVRYGANGKYNYKTLTGGTACTNAVFGDPLAGTAKQCEIPSASDWTFCASERGVCSFTGTFQVRYGANTTYAYKTITNGTACSNTVFGDPLPGVAKHCDVSGGGTTSPPPPPPPTASASVYGPRSTILCPAGAIDIWPGTNIQSMVNTYLGSTTFCLRAGVHSITRSITPKSGNTFVGEYGAVLDGTGWATTDPNQAAFRAHNEDINNVTIRNLLIRKMPQRGIHAYYQFSDGWTVEYNEITATQIAVAIPNNSVVRNNYIHHNSGGGYNGWKIANTTFDTNQISYNGTAQKIFNTNNVTFRNNFIHHNTDGIHFDSDNSDAVIEGNRLEDNGRNAIFYEASQRAVIRNNTVSRSGDTGIFISMSKNVETYGNTMQDNFRAIQYFLNCDVIGGGAISFDLANNSTHDNNIRVDTTSGAFSNALTLLSSCSSTAAAPYLNGSKNLTFQNNRYTVPYIGRWWVWGFNGFKFWNEWQALPQDSTGTVQ